MKCLAIILKILLIAAYIAVVPAVAVADIFNISFRYIVFIIKKRNNPILTAVSGSFVLAVSINFAGLYAATHFSIE